MTDADPPVATGPSSVKGPALLVMTLLLAALAAYNAYLWALPRPTHRATLMHMGLAQPTTNTLLPAYTDADGDLVADAPADPAQLIDPDPLTFSYVASKEAEHYQRVWEPFVAHLAATTGRRVEYVAFSSNANQLKAVKEGKLHVCGLNTGSMPTAVNACGFVPAFTMGRTDGEAGYKMLIITPADSSIRGVPELRGHMIAFTSMGSNSGFKAPTVILMHDFGMEPERDYLWAFSFGHNQSIQGVATGRYEAAAVASDMLDRAVGRGDVKRESLRVLYESERFPMAGLGYVYNLKPGLVAKVREAFRSFDWKGTTLETEFAPTGVVKFIPLSYKDDFALVRRIDDAMGVRHAIE